MLNYAVDAELMREFVPAGTELDQFEGSAFVSLIGFEFNKTRVLNQAVPFHQSFEEVNLRFYVRHGSRRGVVFICELVPKLAVAAIARLVYGERYSCVPMSHRVDTVDRNVKAEYGWGSGPGCCSMALQTSSPSYMSAEGSLSQFITEHYWGYAVRGGRTLEYQVDHPQWKVRDAETARFSGDAERYYGPAFAKVLEKAPDSAFLAEGSAVTVFRGMPLN